MLHKIKGDGRPCVDHTWVTNSQLDHTCATPRSNMGHIWSHLGHTWITPGSHLNHWAKTGPIENKCSNLRNEYFQLTFNSNIHMFIFEIKYFRHTLL